MRKSTVQSKSDWEDQRALFSRYLAGDTLATRTLFSELLRVLLGYFGARMGSASQSDVEDMAQATLLKIHLARDRYDPTQSLKTWVFTIASRALIDHWRGAAYEKDAFVDEPQHDSEEGSGPSHLELAASDLLDPERKTELHRDINQALSKLKPMERSIVYLYGVEGLSMAEIGEVLSITESAAKLRAHRAYQELRKSLGVLLLFGWIARCLEWKEWIK